MKQQKKAFTIIELLVVMATVVILAAMVLPALAATKGKSQLVNCLNNLKQMNLAFRLWESDNGGSYPMGAPAAFGGANEFVAHSSFTSSATPQVPISGVFCPGMAYMVMSNELATAKVLYCPSDNIHTANNGYATNFTYQDLLDVYVPGNGTYPSSKPAAQNGEQAGSGANSKISYFVNADATTASPQDILSGDDNIGNNGATSSSAAANYRFGANITTEQETVAGASTCVGITSVAWSGSPYWAWTPNDFHQKSGNLTFVDGSCQTATISGLHNYLHNSTNSASAEAINFMP